MFLELARSRYGATPNRHTLLTCLGYGAALSKPACPPPSINCRSAANRLKALVEADRTVIGEDINAEWISVL